MHMPVQQQQHHMLSQQQQHHHPYNLPAISLADSAWEGGGPQGLPSPTPIYRRHNGEGEQVQQQLQQQQQQQQQHNAHHLPPIQQKIVPGGRAKVKIPKQKQVRFLMFYSHLDP